MVIPMSDKSPPLLSSFFFLIGSLIEFNIFYLLSLWSHYVCSADYRYGVVPRNYNTVLNNCNYQTDIRPMVGVPTIVDTGTRRRLFAGFRPLSGLGLGRLRSAQNRSISLPESKSSHSSTFLCSRVLYQSIRS